MKGKRRNVKNHQTIKKFKMDHSQNNNSNNERIKMLTLFTQLSRDWWHFAVRGVLAIVFGILALVFLLFRPQGLFGEKIIDRV